MNKTETTSATNPQTKVTNFKSNLPDHEVTVIGAGFSGIGAGIELKRAGIDSFIITEKADDLGGTWRDNTYPGIAVDITSFTYSFSFEPNPYWSRVFAPGRELKQYADNCATKYGLRPHFRYNTSIKSSTWNEQKNYWELVTESGDKFTSRYIISCTGGLTQPKAPDIPGIKKFKGRLIHTARWDHNLDLSGQRVGIIGTGATSVQLVPAIAAKVKELHVFQRTPIWIFPKFDGEISPALKWVFKNIPATQKSVRFVTDIATEIVMVLGIVYNKQTPFLIKAVEAYCLNHLKNQVPDPVLRAKLTPKYGFGCKRPSFSSEYYLALGKDNVDLVTDPITEITENEIITQDGRRREVDTLITATGFKVFEKGNTPTYKAFGKNGVELGDFWDKKRYQAYEGASVPGFPNMFHTLAPYSTGGSSWFSMVEAQVGHALRCITEAHKRNATKVEVKQEPHDAYFAEILKKQKNTVFFNNDCGASNSYYFDKHGDAPFIRPASGLEMYLHSKYFPLDDYRYS